MRVIFLDFDGVLNCERQWYHDYTFIENYEEKVEADPKLHLDPTLVSTLHWILTACGKPGDEIMLVYTTNWKSRFTKSQLADFLEPIIPRSHSYSVAPRCKFSSERGHDIGWWLEKHPEVTKFAIIDDKQLANTLHGHNFFQVDSRDGLTMKIAYNVADHLGINREMPLFLF